MRARQLALLLLVLAACHSASWQLGRSGTPRKGYKRVKTSQRPKGKRWAGSAAKPQLAQFTLPSPEEIRQKLSPDEIKALATQAWDSVRPGQVLFGFGTALALTTSSLFFTGNVIAEYLTEGGRGQVVERALLFGNILDSIREAYVEDNVDVDQLFQTGVNAMLSSLDPYSAYENALQSEDLTMRTVGRYGGVGLTIGKDGDEVVVLGALEGYSFDAGMRPGDKILRIDGERVGGKGMTVDQVKNKLRGAPGTQVSVVVSREGDVLPELTFQLQRKQVRLRDIPLAAMMPGGVGYIKLDAFSEGTAEETGLAISRLQKQGMAALVLDLRDNPGGLLEAAVSVSQQLVSEGTTIVSTAGRGGIQSSYISYRSVTAPLLQPDCRLVVIVNGNTASAAEIVSGVVQDTDRGVVVGQKSFGKGLVQVVEPLPGGAALKLTVAKYYTPSGRCIQAISYRDSAAKRSAVQAVDVKGAGGGAAPAQGSEGEGSEPSPPEETEAEPYSGGRRRPPRRVPEAERKTFYTARGRAVKDGGGIVPDVATPPRKMGELERILLEQGLFYRFAGEWLAAHRGPPAEQQQQLQTQSEAAYQDFVQFVRRKSSGDSALLESPRVAAQLDQLQKSLEASAGGEGGGSARATKEVGVLREIIMQEHLAQFTSQKGAIKQSVVEAVLGRLTPPSERLLASLSSDPQVTSALELANDAQRYSQILEPPPPTSSGAEAAPTDALPAGVVLRQISAPSTAFPRT